MPAFLSSVQQHTYFTQPQEAQACPWQDRTTALCRAGFAAHMMMHLASSAWLTYGPPTRVMLMEYWPPPIGHGWPTAILAKHAAPAGGAGVALGVVVGALVVVDVGVSLGVVVGARVMAGVGGGVTRGGGGGGGAAPAWYQGVSPTVLCSQATFAHIICDA